MFGLREMFRSAHDDVPLHEREILEIAPSGFFDDDTPERYDGRVVNFNTYLDDGRPPEIDGLKFQDQYIDWDSDDAYTRALEEIRENVFERIENSPELQELLAKESWTRDDRVAWERGVSEIVSEEHKAIPGLGTYRNNSDEERYPDVERRASRLNDLSSDIENGTAFIEHDCEAMSILEGVILQQVDNAFLPEEAPEGDYREASNYFYAVGRTNFNPEYNGDGTHAFIISSATTNIIEATNTTGSPYKENANPEMTFSDFINGDMVIANDASIYTGLHHSVADITRVRFENGEISSDAIFDQMPTPDDITQDRYNDAPPEAQVLMELKGQIEELIQLRDEGCVIEDKDINEIIAERRAEFDSMIEEMVDSASVQDTMRFVRDVEWYKGTYVDPDTRIEAAYDKVAEMHPDWDERQIRQFVFELEVGAIPGYGVLSSTETYELWAEKAAEVFAERHPDLDYDEAKRAYNNGEINNRLQAMNRGDISREELLQDPQAAMAVAYQEAHRGMSKLYPIPGSAGAYAQIGKRLDAFEREYEEFTGERETCESVNEMEQNSSVLSSILPRF